MVHAVRVLLCNSNSEKHCYLQNIDEVSRAIDEHISGIKYDIDAVHLDMKNKLKEMRSKMSRKIQHVRGGLMMSECLRPLNLYCTYNPNNVVFRIRTSFKNRRRHENFYI
jgi:hypothetical protein